MTQLDDKEWIKKVRGVKLPPALASFALHALGLGPDLIRRLDDVPALDEALAGVQFGRDTTPHLGEDDKYESKPFDFAEFKRLLRARPLSYRHATFEAEWVRSEPRLLRGGAEDNRPLFSMPSSPALENWYDDFCRLIAQENPCLELYLLLPRQTMERLRGGARPHWDFVQPVEPLSGRENALRLLSCLSVLGLMSDDWNHKKQGISNLVVRSQELFQQVGVSTGSKRHQPEDAVLRKQLTDVARGVVMIHPQVSRYGQDNPWAEPFAVDFSKFWKGNPNRYRSWLLRDRPGDFIEAAEALLWLLVQTSGICVRLSLTPRLPEVKEADVRILAPAPWIKFLKEGHGERRHVEVFEPRRLVDDPAAPLMTITGLASYVPPLVAKKKKPRRDARPPE